MGSYSVSVREICEFSLLSGSIDNRFAAGVRMQEGIRLHQYIQSAYGPDDEAEVALTGEYSRNEITMHILGRADGVLRMSSSPTIEEIKSTSLAYGEVKEPLAVHLAQCRMYAYLYAVSNNLASMGLKVTYVHLSTRRETSFEYNASFAELKGWFEELCAGYADHLVFIENLTDTRNESIQLLRFPFEFRRYQKETINYIYRCIIKKTNVFMNAPTGSGKTQNTLYPSIKALPNLGSRAKVFYLTGKSTQKAVALNAMDILARKGLKAKTVEITAKEKACMIGKPKCNPRDCPYALDYYEKSARAMKEFISSNDIFTFEVFKKAAEEYTVCPFEFSLDASLYADVIVCDYNYVFDPHAALKRYFEDAKGMDYIFLADEAHNLPERSRQMYSEEMTCERLRYMQRHAGKLRRLNEAMDSLYDCLQGYSLLCDNTGSYIFDEPTTDFTSAVTNVSQQLENFLERADSSDERYSDLLDYYYELMRFSSLIEMKGDSHVFYYDKENEMLKLFCTDAKGYLADTLAKGRAAVFFSATLTPLEYYRDILGGGPDDKMLNIDSIFAKENFKIVVDTSIETTYARRALYYKEAAKRIRATVTAKPGNYIIYFPSYAYMQSVYDEYKKAFGEEGCLIQKRQMREKEREEFLSHFTLDSVTTAFAVIGGVFGEAVDLVGDKLIGVVICGVSLPMICTERELIRSHFDKQGRDGFDYAYVYPGMNKVLQAMGRVIRTSDDKGCAVLLDKRFNYTAYKRCFPPQYDQMVFVNSLSKLQMFLKMSPSDDGYYYPDEP